MKTVFHSILFLFYGVACFAQPIPTDSLYLGQTPPGSTPKIFAPGFISLQGRNEHAAFFCSDGKTFYFTKMENNWSKVTTYVSNFTDSGWSEPAIVDFTKQFSQTAEIIVTNTNDFAFFVVRIEGWVSDFWMVKKDTTTGKWGSPYPVDKTVNNATYQWHPTISRKKNLYYDEGGDIMVAKMTSDSSFSNPVKVTHPVNDKFSDKNTIEPFIAPDESYLIYMESGNCDGGQFYISYQFKEGQWTFPKSLGSTINTGVPANGPFVSPDGKYFFHSKRKDNTNCDADMDIYWVSASFIDSLKHTNFEPYLKSRISSQIDTVGKPYNFTVPDSVFFDDDGNNTLTYSAVLNNGNILPTWLSFNAATKTFSGTPTAVGSVSIKVTATDTAKASVSTSFTLNITASKISSIKQTYEQNIQIYPNPTKDKISISFGTMLYSKALIEVSDIAGKQIVSSKFYNEPNAIIDLTENLKGIYLISINIDGEILNRKICFE